MAVVICVRCDALVDLDWKSDDVVVLKGTTDYCHWHCLSDEESEEYGD